MIYINPIHDVGIILSSVSNALTEQYKMILLGQQERKIHLDIVIQANQTGKFKEQDPESNLERLKYLISLFDELVPITYNIIQVEKIPFRSHAIYTSLWPFKKTWVGDKNYIMLKRNANGYHDFKNNQTRGLSFNNLKLYAKEKQMQIIEFDYSDKFEWIVENIIHSRFVVSEYSAMAIIATFLKCPLKIFSEKKLGEHNGRTITFGNGNLGINPRVDFPNNTNLIQGYENSIENITMENNFWS